MALSMLIALMDDELHSVDVDGDGCDEYISKRLVALAKEVVTRANFMMVGDDVEVVGMEQYDTEEHSSPAKPTTTTTTSTPTRKLKHTRTSNA